VRSLDVRTLESIRSSIGDSTSVQQNKIGTTRQLRPVQNSCQIKYGLSHRLQMHPHRCRCRRYSLLPVFGIAVHRTLMPHRYKHRCSCPRHLATAHRDSRSSRSLQNADDTRCHQRHRSRHTCGFGTLTPIYVGRCERDRRNHSLHQRGD
jgi:hypothetical protein